MLNPTQIEQLIQKAKKARENAFLLKTEHKVGAAILTTDNQIFTGCNVEGVILDLSLCAERVAINNAISAGKYEFKALLIYDQNLCLPCGACRQYLVPFNQLVNNSIQIIIASESEPYQITTLAKLLPNAYLTKDPDKIKKLHSYKNK